MDHFIKFCRKEKKIRFLSDELENKNEDEEDFDSNNCSSSDTADFFTFNQKKVSHKKSNQNKNVNEWLHYIENNGKRPKTTGKTIISSNHSEKAINKPIVRGKLANKLGKIFFDSGSEMNLINTETARMLARNNTALTNCILLHVQI